MKPEDYQKAATILGCEIAVIKAVAEVESSGAGFSLVNGKPQPIICFEPHVFWKRLIAHGLDPRAYVKGNEDILYKNWIPGRYPKGQLFRYNLLDKAAKINRNAALESASWGSFQIMGFNWEVTHCKTLQEFINRMYKDDGEQLVLFCEFVIRTGLARYLRNKEWGPFADAYNGPSDEKNNYSNRLEWAYRNAGGVKK